MKHKKEILELLNHLKKDCEMALDGTWDRSDDGFEASLKNVERIITLIKQGGK